MNATKTPLWSVETDRIKVKWYFHCIYVVNDEVHPVPLVIFPCGKITEKS